jgi:hypothetical protein
MRTFRETGVSFFEKIHWRFRLFSGHWLPVHLGYQHVRRLHVAMDNALLCACCSALQAGTNSRNRKKPPGLAPADALQPVYFADRILLSE